MKNWRVNAEVLFEKIGLHIYTNPIIYLLSILFFTIILSLYLPNIKVDMSPEAALHTNDPVLIEYKQFLEKYGKDTNIIVAIKSDNIFSHDFLNTLIKLHNTLEEQVPAINQIKSLVNVRNIRGEDDNIIIEGLLDKWPQSDYELQQTKIQALSNPFYKHLYISENGKMTTIILETGAYSSEDEDEDEIFFKEEIEVQNIPISNNENYARIAKLNTIIQQFDSPNFKIYLTGPPIVLNELTQTMASNIKIFIILSFLIIILVLYLIFRRISGVLLPLSIVFLTLLLTFSFMALLQTPITVTSQIIPSFLIVVGISDSIHILTIFYKKLEHYQEKKKAIIEALGHSSLAITLTTLTTAVGLSAFALSDVAVISQLSVYTAIGVFIALILTIILLPALISILPIQEVILSNRKKQLTDDFLDHLFDRITIIVFHHANKIVYGFFIISAISVILSLQLRGSYYPLKWLSEDNTLRIATELIDKEMKGSVLLEILIKTNVQNKLYNSDFAYLVDNFITNSNQISADNYHPAKAISYTSIIKEINKALYGNDKTFYKIPKSDKLIAQELLLFDCSGQDDLNQFVDNLYSTARISILLPRSDAMDDIILIDQIKKHLITLFNPQYSIVFTGGIPLVSKVVVVVRNEFIFSYLMVYGLITVIMILLLGSIRIGLISMIPNIFPILLGLGYMVLYDIPMGIMTILIGTIAIGLSVDDTIHFMHHFKRNYEKTEDIEMSIRLTLKTTGRAILFTSLILTLGFIILVFASMQNIINFGMILSIIVIMALLADIILAPALMVLYYKKKSNASNTK